MVTPLRVLILEDRPADAELMVHELRRAGFAPDWQRVETEAEYAAALRRDGQPHGGFDVILADYVLPQFNALRALHLLQGWGLDIPFIVVTGSVGEEVAVECMREGAADYLLKDRMARLGPAVERALEEKRLRDEKRRAESRLRLLSSAVEQSTEGIAVSDLEGNLLFVNHAFAAMHGYEPEELVGRHLSIFHTPQQMAAVEAANRQIQETGEFSGEIWHARRDGSVFPGLMHNSLLRDERGDPIGMIGTLRDITGHKQAEEEIRRLKEFNEGLINNMAEGITVQDAEGYFTFVNPAAAALLGYTPEELVGRYWTVVVPPDQRAIVEAADERRARGEADRYEVELVHTDGGRLSVLVSGSPRFEDGRFVGTLAVFTDITGQKQAQEALRQQERLAAVGQLAGGVAHDFNNFLTTIMLYAQIPLGRHDLPPDVARALETIISESRQAARLVQQILDFSRRSPIEVHPVDLKSFVRESIRVLRRTIPESISFLLEVGPGEHIVNADPTRIQQVLMNLVVNARDAMPAGGELRIGLERVEIGPGGSQPLPEMEAEAENRAWVCLAVSDTGTGMTEDVQSHLFEPFFTTKEPGKGTGLGLAQVHGIVKQHGGYIQVESEVGRGTTFRIYLPAHEAERAEPLEKARDAPRGRGETILLAEDDEALRGVAQEILESLGYRVLPVTSGQEALEMYRAMEGTRPGQDLEFVEGGGQKAHPEQGRRIDLVLTDLVMPKMGGMELIQALKKIDPHVKVLVITGYALAADMERLGKIEIQGTVRKPFEMDALAEVVRRALDGE